MILKDYGRFCKISGIPEILESFQMIPKISSVIPNFIPAQITFINNSVGKITREI